jgi:hypothetical protein
MRITWVVISILSIAIVFVLRNTAIAETHWMIYQNNDYGFTMRYPANLHPQQNFETSYFLPNTWRVFNSDPENYSETGKAIVSIPVFKVEHVKSYPTYYTAEVRIGASNNAKDIANCIKDNNNIQVINGTSFHVFSSDDEGMMHYMRSISYRVIHNNQCFAIDQIETGSKMYLDDGMPNQQRVPDAVLHNYYAEAGKIIETFNFTK